MVTTVCTGHLGVACPRAVDAARDVHRELSWCSLWLHFGLHAQPSMSLTLSVTPRFSDSFLSAISDEFYDVYSDAYYDTGTP